LSQSEADVFLQRCRQGDARALEALVQAHHPAVYRMALSLLDDPAEADEAAQESLIAAVRGLASFRGEAALTAWLYRITLNVCRGQLRKRLTRERLQRLWRSVMRVEAAVVHPEAVAVQNDADRRLWAVVQALPEREREAVVLRYYHQLLIGEMARVLAVTERTVHNRLHAAHERLRARLGDEADL
jgi:RNA polymerase sigma-70 factor (ECF subfamily)